MSKYTYSIWRRKTASAQVKLFVWKWKDMINWKEVNTYITRSDLFDIVYTPLKITKLKDNCYFEIIVNWSWISSQAEAIKLGLSRAIVVQDKWLRPILKEAGLLTRDARKVERKKPGKHKARKWIQWSKR